MYETLNLIGTSPHVRALEAEIIQAAHSDAKVLITGESGTGKEVTARLIHERSRRRQLPMATINCAGIPDSLLESEFFGHKRGSFTGAYRDRQGVLESAHRSTLFLDEIGEMTSRMQGLLLRFLETGEIQPVGSERMSRVVDLRVIAATNRDLVEKVASNEFRLDLYYRLNVIHLRVSPLRDRREDVLPFVEHFAERFSAQYRVPKREFSREVLARMRDYDWPGNVRQLKNVVERLVVRYREAAVSIEELPLELQQPAAAPVVAPAGASRADVLFERMVRAGESFWSVVYDPFMRRDLTRDDVRVIVRKGLGRTRGSYTDLVGAFNMSSDDYKRFLNFLRKHQCQIEFQPFRAPEQELPACQLAS